MDIIRSSLYFIVCFVASVAGAICGIGGGVIVKPVLDVFGWDSVSTISFLSGCMVLTMSCYSVGRSMLAGEKTVNAKTITPLAIGASLGGIAGKQLFGMIKAAFEDPNRVGGVQAACLTLITVGTLLYTVYKSKIKPHQAHGMAAYVVIGLVLGIMSSFLGIGGGPINIVVLHFFFAMDSKTAAANSLYVIAFSQLTSLLFTLITGTVPDFKLLALVFMVLGGLLGGMFGRRVNKKMDNRAVDKLFIGMMTVIIFISIYNCVKYFTV